MSSILSGFDWLKNQMILFALFTPIFIIFKYLISSTVRATAENFDNLILRLLILFLLPGLIGVGIAYLGILTHCDALAKFALFVAISVGGISTYALLYLINMFLPIPFFLELSMIFIILIALSIAETVIPIFLPGLGTIISLILSVVQLIVIYIYAGGQISGVANCFINSVKGKAIPGTGGVSIGA